MALRDLFCDVLKNQTQKSIAEEMGINEKTISANLTGKAYPRPSNARKYIKFLKKKGIEASLNEIYE
jgi:transcriptional regulator with XRE-family HTH domain